MEKILPTFKWSVQNFNVFPLPYEVPLFSQKFYVDDSRTSEFCLGIFIGKPPIIYPGSFATIFLCRCDHDGPENIEISYKISLEPNVKSSTYKRNFLKPEHNSSYRYYEEDEVNFPIKDISENTVKCHCTILSYEDGGFIKSVYCDTDLIDLSHAFEKLLSRSLFSDTAIKMPNQEFKVHRAILEARCPALLKLPQKIETQIPPHHTEDSLKKLLYYIYTGKFEYNDTNEDVLILLKHYCLLEQLQACIPISVTVQTSFNVTEISFDWTIENFLDSSMNKEFSHVLTESEPYACFKLSLIRSKSRCGSEKLKFVMRKIYRNLNVFVYCRIQVNTCNVAYLPLFKEYHSFIDEKPWEVEMDHHMKLIRENASKDFSTESVNFKISLEITDGLAVNVVTYIQLSYRSSSFQNVYKMYRLSNDMKKLFINAKHTDVTLKVGGRNIKAHKAILSARSQKFREIFQQREFLKELENAMQDLSVNVAVSMICYIYSAQLIRLDVDLALDLYDAAKKFKIPLLKKMCCNFLKESINETNVTKILLLSDAQSDNALKKCVYDFINSNATSVLENREFRGVMKSFHGLHFEALKRIQRYR